MAGPAAGDDGIGGAGLHPGGPIAWSARIQIGATVAALAAMAATFDALAPIPDRANVLLITLDTTRADHLSAYGYFRSTTPNLARLSRRSLIFDRAWAPMATTLPSHTSLMTGTWPLEHGVLGNVEHGGRRSRPSDGLVPLAELFSDAGWRTGAFVSAVPVYEGTGIERGFAAFDQWDRPRRHARATTDAAAKWIREQRKAPFFAWVHYYDPHGPFTPPEVHDRFSGGWRLDRWIAERGIPERAQRAGGADLDPREAHDRYDGELRYVDAQIDRLLALLRRRGLSDRTVIVVVGDHGEGLGQHDVGGHGHVWREQLQVPLIIHVPWMRGRRVATPASMVDVGPTLLGLIRVPGGDRWRRRASGQDVLSAPSGPSLGLSSIRQTQLGTIPQRSLTAGDWRLLLVDAAPRLFHLATDPHERVDLSAVLPVHRRILARWMADLEGVQRARGSRFGPPERIELPADEIEQLRALGYVEP